MPCCQIGKWMASSRLQTHASLDFHFNCLRNSWLHGCTGLQAWPSSTRTERRPLMRLHQRHWNTYTHIDILNPYTRRQQSPPSWLRQRLIPLCGDGERFLSSSCCAALRCAQMPGTLFATTQVATSHPTTLHVQPAEALAVRKTGIACRMPCASRRITTMSVTRVQIRTG